MVAVALLSGWGGLLYLQAGTLVRSAGRRVGFVPDEGAAGILVAAVEPSRPAARAGLLPGDEVLAVDGRTVAKVADYDRAAAAFRQGRPATFRVLRAGRARELAVVPGVAPDWRSFAVGALTALAFLAVALLALAQQGSGLKARLLLAFSAAVAFELALPIDEIGDPWLGGLALSSYYLLTGLQIGLELHLASLIPERQGWLVRHPWAVGAFYAAGLGLGTAASVTYAAEELFGRRLFPWSSGEVEAALLSFGMPFWALGVTWLLARQALHYPDPRGRHQAGLVLAGVLPWCLVVVAASALDVLGRPAPGWLAPVEQISLVCYPVAFFAAIFSYDLFDVELVVRHSLIYTALTGTLILLFYAALGAGGALFSILIGGEGSIWVVSAATLLLGLLFSPLRRSLQRLIDRRFFPERQALRQRLIGLASELPALGKLPLMGEHLVTRLCAIFSARSATLLIAAPDTGLLAGLASTLPAFREKLDEPPLLALDDPGVDLLRHAQRPLPAVQVTGKSPLLAQKLGSLDLALAVPLLVQERLIGVLLVGRRQGSAAYPAEEVELLALLAHHIATVFENARLFESATYESLTGLLRREAILDQLGRELERARRYRRPLTIAMADLDHFKAVNDRYGHLAGDALLKRVAQAAAGGLRSTDWMGRYGGEEFLLVLPETGIEGAAGVAEKVRSLIEGTAVPMEDGSLARVTVSIGIAALEEVAAAGDKVTPRDLIAAADRSLYEAKSSGRNRVHPLVLVA